MRLFGRRERPHPGAQLTLFEIEEGGGTCCGPANLPAGTKGWHSESRTNQPLLAIEVDGFAFHENSPDQRARDALKDAILDAHQMPLLRLPTTGSREYQQIRQALDNSERHWARLSAVQ